jgi:hypothetical protein
MTSEEKLNVLPQALGRTLSIAIALPTRSNVRTLIGFFVEDPRFKRA